MRTERLLWLAAFGLLALLACAGLSRLTRAAPRKTTRLASTAGRTAALRPNPSPAPSASPEASSPSRFESLPPIHLVNQTSGDSADVKLYDPSGRIDEAAAAALDELLCDARSPGRRETTTINRRTLQLLFKAAYHFGAREVQVVSAYRKPDRRHEGPHGTGAAIDFRLRGIDARTLASYLRGIPRTGVGFYSHPKTQFVHLDSREHSFHWLDASPPRRHWRELSIGARDLKNRDALYSPDQDWP